MKISVGPAQKVMHSSIRTKPNEYNSGTLPVCSQGKIDLVIRAITFAERRPKKKTP